MKTILQYLRYIFKSALLPIVFSIYFSGIIVKAQSSSFDVAFDYKCSPTVVTLTNTSSTGAGIEYLWDFGKGAIFPSDEEVLYEAYTQAGYYTITLAVVNGSDTVRSSQEIYIATGPRAAFTADSLEGCAPHTVTFSDNSLMGDASIAEVFWDFRDGQTRFGQTIVYTYIQAGNNNVFMRVTDENGCTSYTEIPDLVTIHATPFVNFSASDSFACNAPLTVNFMNLSEGAGDLQSYWNYGNGSTSANFSGSTFYAEDGNYRVSLQITDENNCTDSLAKESFINIGSEAGDLYALIDGEPVFEPNAMLCQGNLIFGSTLPMQADYRWIVDYNGEIETFSNINEIEINAPDSGYIDLTLHYGQTTECPDSISKSFRIDYVRANFEMDKVYTCSLPVDIGLSNTSENYTEIEWHLPDGSSNNQDSLSATVERDLTYEEIYNHQVNLRDIPFILIAANENGCRDTLMRNLVAMLPIARTMPDVTAGCVPFEVEFSDSSHSVESIVEWEFFIEDQTFIRNNNAPFTYTFEDPGIYEVGIAITNDMGCRDTSYIVEIHAGEELIPQMSVDPTAICYGNTINLSSDSPPANLVDSWQYASSGLFNTGTLSSPNTYVALYPSSPGSKDVKLTIESNYCVSDTTLEDAFTVESPTGYFDFHFSCDSPMVYTFVSHFENADGLQWKIGAEEFADVDSLQYVFSETGDFEVTLNAVNSASGCSVSKSRTIKVREVQAAFNVQPIICAGVEIEFNASTSIDYINDCFIEGFLWNFDDYMPPKRNYNPIQSHIYFEEGIYHPWLEVTADNDCVDTMKTLVKVVLPPVAFSADPDTGCGPHMRVDFSYDSLEETISNWVWLFGDNSSDDTNDPTPEHVYHSFYDKEFYATLIATDIYGCQNYSRQLIKVTVPIAYFQAIDPGLCLGQEAAFILSDTELDSYIWDYGDGSPPGTTNTHLYGDTGTYSVNLSVSKDGCDNSLLRSDYISVEQADASYTLSDSTPDCYPASITFTHTGSSGIIASGMWTYQPGIQSAGYDPITEYTYSEPGIYFTSLSIQTANNCVASASNTIVVSGPEIDFVFAPSSICNGDTVNFYMLQSDELDEFEWIFGDGNVSDEITPQHIYYGNGTLYPALRVVKDDCEVTISNQSLRIFAPEARFVIQGENGTQCIDAPLNTTNESSQYNSSIWSIDGIEVSSTNHLTDYYFNQTGEHIILLKIFNSIGCSDSTSQTIELISLPAFQIYGDTLICPGTEAHLHVDEHPGWSISWQPATYVNNSQLFSPLAQPPVNTQFYARVTDENACTDTATIFVRIEEEPNIQRRPVSDTSITIGESLQLFIQSDKENTIYNWSPFHAISCLTCQDPIVNPTSDLTYSVVVQDECFELNYEFNIEVIVNFYLEVPKAFTPNGDGENDIFFAEADHVSEIDFKVFNRWGNLVFSCQDLNEGWDGRYNGKLQNPDTYTYYIRAISDHGYEFEKKGTFLLLK